MESNLIEQYVIDQIATKTAENEQLKKENQKLSDELISAGQTEDFKCPQIGFSYDIQTDGYALNDNTLARYKEALLKEDRSFFENSYHYCVDCYMYNYIVHVDNVTFKLDLEVNNHVPTCSVYKDHPFKTEDEAYEALFNQLAADIHEFEAKAKGTNN